jgi:hypothetical protein
VAELQRIWAQNDLMRGDLLAVGASGYRVLGFDPVSVRPRRLYVEDASSGRTAELEIPGW